MPLWLKIVLCLLLTEILGGLGGIVTGNSIASWFAQLERPPGNPPNWLFGPVWGVLYALMGLALALVWHREKSAERRQALRWWWVQFVLNLIWSPVFFGAHQIAAALVIIVVLLVAIVFTIRAIRRVHPRAALLLVPYLLWVSYATYLNAGFLVLNG